MQFIFKSQGNIKIIIKVGYLEEEVLLQPVIPVFIASPGDVKNEREIAEKAIIAVSDKLNTIFGIALVAIKWENFAPISSGDASHPQYQILKRIEPFSIFIGILYRRYGTKIKEMGDISGTETEFKHAIEHRNHIKILSYFRDQNREGLQDHDTKTLKQILQVDELKQKLRNKNIFNQNYFDEEEFQQRIILDLFETVLQMTLPGEDKRFSNYAKFFLFGGNSRQRDNPLLIVYPSIRLPRIVPDNNCVPNWRKHLFPTIAVEDSKAIQKLESTLRLLNRPYKITADHSNELDYVSQGGRIWVCFGSNKPARKVLERLGEKVRFRFSINHLDDTEKKERYLTWRSNDRKDITVRSPLNKYLSHSERPEGDDLRWKARYGNTYARDYAVLARFKVPDSSSARDDEPFFHYFIGGIRGLGTWGASWYIEHCSKQLAELSAENDDDIQILLEVTYQNYKIIDVKNVSSKEQDFFDERFNDEYIKGQYKEEMDE